MHPVLGEGFANLRRSVGAYRNNLVAQLDELLFDLKQLTQLRIAVGSPAAAIENEHG